MRAKVAYTALQAHLGEVVVRLVGRTAWTSRRRGHRYASVVDEVYDELRAEPRR